MDSTGFQFRQSARTGGLGGGAAGSRSGYAPSQVARPLRLAGLPAGLVADRPYSQWAAASLRQRGSPSSSVTGWTIAIAKPVAFAHGYAHLHRRWPATAARNCG